MENYEYYVDVLKRIFEGRITALKNRVSPLYKLGFYYPDNEKLKELLFPWAAPFQKIVIKTHTSVRNAERVARARISGLARRFDCDVVVLKDETIDGANPLNPDFNEDAKSKTYETMACFYKSADYLNKHHALSRQRLLHRII